MKKLVILSALILVLYNVSYAQYQYFLSGFSPDSQYYEDLCGNTSSHFQLDTLDWTQWIEAGHSPGGASWLELAHYRYVFTYLPDGKVFQIQQYVSSDGTTWGQAYRNTYEYDEQDRMTSYTVDCRWSDGHWQFYHIHDYTYDDLDRVIIQHITGWSGAGYEDSHNEYHYEYDDEGHLIRKAYYRPSFNSYDNQWLYTYENGKLVSRCYQILISSLNEWWNNDLYLYSYNEDVLSSVLHQKWDFNNEDWYNYENTLYEYDGLGTITYATLQTWSEEWVNKSRTTKTHNENGTLVQELYQDWQNETWVDKRRCDYTFDNYGNCINGMWKDYANGEWIESESNNKLFVQYNDGASILSASVQSYQAKYSYKSEINLEGEWYYEIQNDDGSITYQHLEYASDTTIGNERPKIIIRSNTHYDRDIWTEVTHEYVYEENGIVYWWNKDLEEFTTLYDLSANEGDEWEIKVGTESIIMHVDGVEYMDYGGQSYRTLHVSDENDLFSGDIVCSFGHMTSFFPERLMRDTEGFRVEGLRCYWVGDELVYHGEDEDCDAIYTELHGIDEMNRNGFTVYPNPAHNVLFVEAQSTVSQSTTTYRITNLMGQTVLSGSITAENQQINIKSLPVGMYFISVGGQSVKFVVK